MCVCVCVRWVVRRLIWWSCWLWPWLLWLLNLFGVMRIWLTMVISSLINHHCCSFGHHHQYHPHDDGHHSKSNINKKDGLCEMVFRWIMRDRPQPPGLRQWLWVPSIRHSHWDMHALDLVASYYGHLNFDYDLWVCK